VRDIGGGPKYADVFIVEEYFRKSRNEELNRTRGKMALTNIFGRADLVPGKW
jgi:hypothetical protein